MLIVVFIFLGLIVGYVARGPFKTTGKAIMLDLGSGVAGAVIAGSLFSHLTAMGAAGLNSANALVAALAGAVVLLATFHGLRDSRSRQRDPI